MKKLTNTFTYEDYLSLRKAYMNAIIEGKKTFKWNNQTWDTSFVFEVLNMYALDFMKKELDRS